MITVLTLIYKQQGENRRKEWQHHHRSLLISYLSTNVGYRRNVKLKSLYISIIVNLHFQTGVWFKYSRHMSLIWLACVLFLLWSICFFSIYRTPYIPLILHPKCKENTENIWYYMINIIITLLLFYNVRITQYTTASLCRWCFLRLWYILFTYVISLLIERRVTMSI
jgi:hypothetical protein